MITTPMHAVTAERFKMMALAGFVHVTGLQEIDKDGKACTAPIGSNIHPAMFGCYNIWNGQIAVVTYDGQVWLADWTNGNRELMGQINGGNLGEILHRLAPNGQRSIHVPGSDGPGTIPFHDLMARLADPNCALEPRVDPDAHHDASSN